MSIIEVRITHHDASGEARRVQVLPHPFVDNALMSLDVFRAAQEAQGRRPVFIWDEASQETVQAEPQATLWVNGRQVPVDRGELHTRSLARGLAEV